MDLNNPFAQSLIMEGQRRGYSPYDISAAIGNANVENRLRTDGTPGDNGTAFGGMQWRMDRFTALKAKAAAAGKQWNDPGVQASHWYDEQDTDGRKGATSLEQANANVIGSLRPGGYTRNGPLENVSNYQNRANGSAAAYAALNGGGETGGTPTSGGVMSPEVPQADLPAEGAAEAQRRGILMDGQAYQPTMTDSLDKLSAAFFMRDSPQQAQVINNSLKDKMANHAQALRRAQGATERWQTGQPYQQADGKWVVPQTSSAGQRRVDPMQPGTEPKQAAEDDTPTRQEVQATDKRNIALANINQVSTIQGHIDTLREALQHGTFKVGPDRTGKMVLENITGNSSESGRFLKQMESSIIMAATAVAQMQKGTLTNFKFEKDLQAVMPSFSNNDKKAAYNSLKNISEGLADNYNAAANVITTSGRQFKRLNTILHPETGEEVDVGKWYPERIKERTARQKGMYDKEPDFFASPGRGQTPAAKPLANVWDSLFK